jgi:RsiW-degrading membrane proteinase PrsW (M82 family)
MSLFSFFCSVMLPGLLALNYGLIKTRRQMKSEVLWAGFLGGLLVGICCLVVETMIGRVLPLAQLAPLAKSAAEATLVAAGPEEGLKFIALLLVIRRYVYPDDAAATILAAVGVALGFALMEDSLYVIRAFSTSAVGGSLVALMRALTAVPEHLVFGLTMGALIAATRGGGHAELTKNPFELMPALLVPLAMHAGYDFLLMAHDALLKAHVSRAASEWTSQWVPIVMAGSVLIAILLCNRVLAHAARYDKPAYDKASGPAWLGGFLLLVGLLMVWIMLALPTLEYQHVLAKYCVVPLMFGLDLLWTAFSRMNQPMPRGVALRY